MVRFGDIDPEGRAALRHLRRTDEVAGVPRRVPGSHAIRLLDAHGAVLASFPFAPDPAGQDSAGGATFGHVVPFAQGTREVRIVEGPEGRVLATVPVSAGAPEVSGVKLVGAPSPVTGTVTVAWSPMDPDGDPLSFDVLYGPDGESFQPLRLGVRGGEAKIDTSRLGGGAAVVRVVASDGVQSSHADSAPFLVAVKPPEPRIVSPADGARVQWGQLVSFIGEADDLQEGGIPARRLFWTRRRGGESAPLGAGPLVSVADLPVGTHEVAFTAVGRSGLSASASITVTVHDDLLLPGPTLAAGPLSVGWEVASPAARPVAARVHIANAGEGSLQWTATEEAPWLSLDRTSGAAPAAITLTADPAGLRADRAYATELVIASPAAGGEAAQAVTVAVSLVVGDPRAAPAEPALVRGDSNGDGGVDLSDAVFVLSGLFLGGRLPPCRSAADANGDTGIDISDASYVLNFLFLGGRPPPAPFPGCGPAGPDDGLGCQEPPAACRCRAGPWAHAVEGGVSPAGRERSPLRASWHWGLGLGRTPHRDRNHGSGPSFSHTLSVHETRPVPRGALLNGLRGHRGGGFAGSRIMEAGWT